MKTLDQIEKLKRLPPKSIRDPAPRLPDPRIGKSRQAESCPRRSSKTGSTILRGPPMVIHGTTGRPQCRSKILQDTHKIAVMCSCAHLLLCGPTHGGTIYDRPSKCPGPGAGDSIW